MPSLSSLNLQKKTATAATLDFRFADEEDAPDIAMLVNSAYAIEKGETGEAFRKNDATTAEEVESSIDEGSRRWYLAEDKYEQVLACACFSSEYNEDGGKKKLEGRIHLLAVQTPFQKEGIGARTLHRVESVLKSMGARLVHIAVPHWRDSLQSWAKRQGYAEMGGEIWNEDQQGETTRTTMLLDFQKKLTTAAAAAKAARKDTGGVGSGTSMSGGSMSFSGGGNMSMSGGSMGMSSSISVESFAPPSAREGSESSPPPPNPLKAMAGLNAMFADALGDLMGDDAGAFSGSEIVEINGGAPEFLGINGTDASAKPPPDASAGDMELGMADLLTSFKRLKAEKAASGAGAGSEDGGSLEDLVKDLTTSLRTKEGSEAYAKMALEQDGMSTGVMDLNVGDGGDGGGGMGLEALNGAMADALGDLMGGDDGGLDSAMADAFSSGGLVSMGGGLEIEIGGASLEAGAGDDGMGLDMADLLNSFKSLKEGSANTGGTDIVSGGAGADGGADADGGAGADGADVMSMMGMLDDLMAAEGGDGSIKPLMSVMPPAAPGSVGASAATEAVLDAAVAASVGAAAADAGCCGGPVARPQVTVFGGGGAVMAKGGSSASIVQSEKDRKIEFYDGLPPFIASHVDLAPKEEKVVTTVERTTSSGITYIQEVDGASAADDSVNTGMYKHGAGVKRFFVYRNGNQGLGYYKKPVEQAFDGEEMDEVKEEAGGTVLSGAGTGTEGKEEEEDEGAGSTAAAPSPASSPSKSRATGRTRDPKLPPAAVIYERLFRSVTPEDCKRLSIECRDKQEDEKEQRGEKEELTTDAQVMDFVYGEVTFEPMVAVLDGAVKAFKEGAKAKADKERKKNAAIAQATGVALEGAGEDEDESTYLPKSFVDLGSGVGRAVVIASLMQPCLKLVYGIELLEGLHKLGDHLLGFYRKLFLPKLGAEWQGQQVELVMGDFLQTGPKYSGSSMAGAAATTDWSKIDIVFAHSTCFGDDLLRKVSKECEQLEPGAVVITTSHVLHSAMFEIVETQQHTMTWGSATVYIQRKKPMSKWAARIVGGNSHGARTTQRY
jgi:hypothetical protein